MMKLDDPSLLSAYLDGELDTAGRLVVEEALLTEPALAERLQELARVRSVIHTLARPTALDDVAGPVMTRIAAYPGLRRRRALRHRLDQSRWVRPAVTLAVAAVVLGAVGLSLRPPGPVPGPPRSPRVDVASTVGRLEPPPPPALDDPPPAAVEAGPAAPDPAPEVAVAADRLDPVAREIRRREGIRRVQGLFDRADSRRLVLVVDSLDSDHLGRVEAAIQESERARPLLGAVHVMQGVVIDPRRPHEAVVYAVVLDESEADDLRHNLDLRFPGSLSADEPVPAPVAVQLADLEPVRVLEGDPAHDLAAPPSDRVAFAERTEAPGELVMPGPTGLLPIPVPEDRPSDPVRPRPSGTVYLVWVTTATPGRASRG